MATNSPAAASLNSSRLLFIRILRMRIWVLPGTTVRGKQFVRSVRSPRTRGVVRKVACVDRSPNFKDRVNDPPTRLDHVRALEQRLIPDHAVVKKAFIPGTDLLAEMVDVIEIHIDGSELDDRSRNFRTEVEGDAFVRLNVDLDPVRSQAIDRSIAEEDERCPVELHDD